MWPWHLRCCWLLGKHWLPSQMLDRLCLTMVFRERIIMAQSSTVSNISILHAKNGQKEDIKRIEGSKKERQHAEQNEKKYRNLDVWMNGSLVMKGESIQYNLTHLIINNELYTAEWWRSAASRQKDSTNHELSIINYTLHLTPFKAHTCTEWSELAEGEKKTKITISVIERERTKNKDDDFNFCFSILFFSSFLRVPNIPDRF